jgi:hypothetical protein
MQLEASQQIHGSDSFFFVVKKVSFQLAVVKTLLTQGFSKDFLEIFSVTTAIIKQLKFEWWRLTEISSQYSILTRSRLSMSITAAVSFGRLLSVKLILTFSVVLGRLNDVGT